MCVSKWNVMLMLVFGGATFLYWTELVCCLGWTEKIHTWWYVHSQTCSVKPSSGKVHFNKRTVYIINWIHFQVSGWNEMVLYMLLPEVRNLWIIELQLPNLGSTDLGTVCDILESLHQSLLGHINMRGTSVWQNKNATGGLEPRVGHRTNC